VDSFVYIYVYILSKDINNGNNNHKEVSGEKAMRYVAGIVFALMCSTSYSSDQNSTIVKQHLITITANPISTNLFLSPTKVVSANIVSDDGSSIEIIRVELRLNRDRDPSHFSLKDAPTITVYPPFQAGNVAVTLPSNYVLEPAQLLTVQWSLDYRLPTGDVDTVSSIATVRQACTATDITDFLKALQTTVTNPRNFPQRLESETDLIVLNRKGYVPTHSFVSFRGMGVAFAVSEPLRPKELIEMGESIGLPQFTLKPHLLLYAPNSTNEQQITEPLFPDFPYTLIGFAFASPYDPAGPPVFGCMPRETWFVHEAGWHLPNGGFIIQDIDESAPGNQNPRLPSPIFIPPNDLRFGGIWHPRLWDVHLWINSNTSTSDTPIVSMCNRTPGLSPLPDFFAITSATTCNNQALLHPLFGRTFSSGGFFVRTLPP